MRKAADLQEDVMKGGIHADQIPKSFAPSSNPASVVDGGGASTDQTPLFNQIVLEGQIHTDDNQLKDRVKSLRAGEVLVLRGDRQESLVYKGESLNEQLVKQHLTCLIVPHDFRYPQQTQNMYLQRFLAIYILYKQGSIWVPTDDVVKAFYL